MNTLLIRVGFLLVGAAFIWLGTALFSPRFSELSFDYHGPSHVSLLPYPLTLNNMMWMVFFFGLSEVIIRFRAGGLAVKHLEIDYIGMEPGAAMTIGDLGGIQERLIQLKDAYGDGFLPRLLESILRSLKTSGSIGSALAVMNTNVELYFHVIESRYTRLDYLNWLIPTLGFIGTVMGVAQALETAGMEGQIHNENLLRDLARTMMVAFTTTFIALVQAALLVGFKAYLVNRDEGLLNKSAQYCVERVLNDIDARS